MSLSKKDNNISIDQIVADFTSPIDNYQEIEIESYEEATEYLNQVAENLSTNQSWKTRCGAIDQTIQLLKGGIQYFPEGDLQSIAPLISTAVLDLRAIIVRKAALLIAIAAKLLKEDFSASAEIIFPSLLKQVSSKNSVISNYCHCSLLEIAKYTSTKQIGLLFINNYSSKILFNRQIAAESCHIISETWPTKVKQALNQEIGRALDQLENDPSEMVRSIANQAISISRQNSPKHKRGQSSLPVSPTGSPKKELSPIIKDQPVKKVAPKQKSGNNQNKQRLNQQKREKNPLKRLGKPENIPQNKEISDKKETIKEQNPPTENLTLKDVLNPSSKKSAIVFKSCLDVIVQSNNYDVVSTVNKKDFVSSVMYSMQQVPTLALWKDDLSSLFKVYPNLFESNIISIMSNFSFDPWIFELATTTYTTQSIAEMFISGKRQRMSDAYRFFVMAFSTDSNSIIIDEKMKSCIQILIQSKPHNEETLCLIEALEGAEGQPSIQNAIDEIILKLQNNEKWTNDLNELVRVCGIDPKLIAIIETRFNDVIPNFVSNGTNEQRRNAIRFISECSCALKKVSFETSIDPVISIVFDNDRKMAISAINCLGKMMNNIKVLAKAIQMLESNPNNVQILIEAMLIYFSEAPPQKMIAIRKILTEKLLPFITSQNQDIRKTITQIFAEFQRKIPKEFGKVLNKKFTPSQRRLIEITAQRSRSVLK